MGQPATRRAALILVIAVLLHPVISLDARSPGLKVVFGPGDMRTTAEAADNSNQIDEQDPYGLLDSAVLAIGSGDVAPGDSIAVPMTAALGSALLGAATVEIQYDPAVVSPTGCAADSGGVFDLALCNVSYAADTIRFTAISAAGVSGDLTLANITFEAVGAAGESSLLALTPTTFASPSGQPLDVTVQDGRISIVSLELPAPTGLAAIAVSQSRIDLTWTDNSTDETAFYIERSPDGVSGWVGIDVVGANVTAYGDSGLTCDSDYFYQVRAYRSGDGQYSGYSNVDGDTTLPCDSAVLAIGSGDVAPGDSIAVPMTAVLGSALLSAATVEIQYDPAVVSPTGCAADPGGAFDMALCNLGYASDTIRFTAISAVGVSGDLTLANITFEAVGAAGESSLLVLTPTTFASPSGQPLDVTVQNGQINIQEPEYHIFLPMLMRSYAPPTQSSCPVL
jgi:hypothetical protein